MKSQFTRIASVITLATMTMGAIIMAPATFAQDAVATTDVKAAHQADRKLARDVRRALEKSRLEVDDVRILVKAGNVNLEGTVPDNDQIAKLSAVAKTVPGVMSIANNVTMREEGGR
jgi:hyperosmotically inducible periplasmic protein